jgi:hypothetical protein
MAQSKIINEKKMLLVETARRSCSVESSKNQCSTLRTCNVLVMTMSLTNNYTPLCMHANLGWHFHELFGYINCLCLVQNHPRMLDRHRRSRSGAHLRLGGGGTQG